MGAVMATAITTAPSIEVRFFICTLLGARGPAGRGGSDRSTIRQSRPRSRAGHNRVEAAPDPCPGLGRKLARAGTRVVCEAGQLDQLDDLSPSGKPADDASIRLASHHCRRTAEASSRCQHLADYLAREARLVEPPLAGHDGRRPLELRLEAGRLGNDGETGTKRRAERGQAPSETSCRTSARQLTDVHTGA